MRNEGLTKPAGIATLIVVVDGYELYGRVDTVVNWIPSWETPTTTPSPLTGVEEQAPPRMKENWIKEANCASKGVDINRRWPGWSNTRDPPVDCRQDPENLVSPPFTEDQTLESISSSKFSRSIPGNRGVLIMQVLLESLYPESHTQAPALHEPALLHMLGQALPIITCNRRVSGQ